MSPQHPHRTHPRPQRPHHRRRLRVLAAGAAAAALVVVPAAAASAHVRVSADTTAAGGYAVLVFRVPNESATASTTRLRVTLPTDHPLTYAAVQPVPGWTAVVDEGPLPAPVEVEGATTTTAPRTITWTATGDAAIAPGQFQQFPVQVGALPDAGTTVLLPAEQTYSDGEVVDWDEPVPASGEEPEHPAPALLTTAAAGAADDGEAAGAGTWLGVTGTVLGGAALVVALARGRGPRAARP